MRYIFYLALLFCCNSALLASYKLAKSGGDLYDFTGNGYNAVASRNGGLPYIITDRGYYIRDKTTLQFPLNSYKTNPGQAIMLIGIWHYNINPGIFFSLSLNSSGNSSIIHLKWLKLSTGYIALEILQDGVSKQYASTSINFGNIYLDAWRFSIFYIYDNAGSVKFEYYRKTMRVLDITYTIPSSSVQNSNTSWSINTAIGGILGFIYEIYWYNDVYTSTSTMFDAIVYFTNSSTPCWYKVPDKACFSTSLDPYSNTAGTSCNVCSHISGICYTSLIGCSSPSCIAGSTPQCLCINHCKECSKDSSDVLVCSECDSGYSILDGSIQYSCTTSCPVLYYKDTSAISTCKKCENNCSICSNDTICNGCILGFYLKNADCVSDCGIGYYLSISSCLPCESNCNICSSDTLCNQCKNGYYLSNGDCLSCESNCNICSSDTVCTSCNMGYYLKNQDCVSDCGVGYYLSSEECLSCEANCDICSSDIICISCSLGYYLKNQDCVLDCGSGYYLENGDCLSCESNCDICSSDTVCTSCNMGYYLKDQDCVSECGAGYYLSNGDCLSCGTNCDICSSDTVCTFCSTGYYLSGSDCLPCQTSCTQCISDAVCTTCNMGYYLMNGDCMIECADGYYLSGSSCQACEMNCKVCSSDNVCTECYSGYNLKNGDCVLECGDGYYISESKCMICESSCKACLSDIVCTNCNSGYYLSGSSCRYCGIHCKTCSNDLVCIECEFGYYLKNQGCVSECGDRYFYSNNVCLPCDNNCLSCSDNICTKCESEYYLNHGICALECNIGYYTENSECLPCNSNCISCNNREICNQCYHGYHPNEGLCEPICAIFCNSCYDSSTCDECKPGYYLKNGECVTECGSEYYLNNSDCKVCDTGCSKCSSDSICEECKSEYFLKDHHCVSDCGEGYYYNTSSCKECPDNCKNCSSDSKCSDETSSNFFIGKTALIVQVVILVSLIVSIVSMEFYGILTLIGNLQMLNNSVLYNISLPKRSIQVLEDLSVFKYIPNLYDYFIDHENTLDDERYERLGITNEVFFNNSGKSLSILLLLIFLIILLRIIRKRIRNLSENSRFKKVTNRILQELEWNFIIGFLIQISLELTVSSLINIVHVSFSDTASTIGFCMSIILFVIYIQVMLVCSPIRLLLFYLKNYHEINENIFDIRYKVLHTNLHSDAIDYLFYNIFYLSRRIVYGVVMILLSSAPYIQVVINSSFSIGIAYFLIIFKPFKSKIDNYMKIYIEVNNSIIISLTGLFLTEKLPNRLYEVAEWTIVILTYAGFALPTLVRVIIILKDAVINFVRRKQLGDVEGIEMNKNLEIHNKVA
jgi:hypothetical protein